MCTKKSQPRTSKALAQRSENAPNTACVLTPAALTYSKQNRRTHAVRCECLVRKKVDVGIASYEGQVASGDSRTDVNHLQQQQVENTPGGQEAAPRDVALHRLLNREDEMEGGRREKASEV